LAAPVSIVHTHVHSLRLSTGTCAGAEALVARVLAADGTAGFGFTMNEDAAVARDMAAWDALGRTKGVALCGLLGGSYRKRVAVAKDDLPAIAPDWPGFRKGVLGNRWELLRIDPFAWGSVEILQTIAASAAAFELGVALLAPNAHPWEIQYCASLLATVKGDDSRVIVRTSPETRELPVKDVPGVGIDWDSEPGFAQIRWQTPQK
jgi:L-alanine-DL-glutamate epimerase-like enolase superfamily enzyme